MTTYSWAQPVSGDWITAANWSPAGVPNEPVTGLTPANQADVSIDNPTLAPYFVTIGAGEVWTVNSLTMNAVNDLQGSNTTAYNAAALNINGTLNFGPGSTGALGGSLQTYVFMNNGTILNPGTLNAFVQGQGNVLLTGTNGLYITNILQAQGGVVTADTKSIGEITGGTLFDGIFDAAGLGGVVNLGGPRQGLIVNIATVEGPPSYPTGWTELTLNGTLTEIGEWNGSGYVGIETTLKDIAARGTVDIIDGRNYVTANTLSVEAGGLLNLQAGTVTAPAIDINGGTVQGSGDITGGVINNGILRDEGGLLTVGTGGLSGVGLVTFDLDQKTGAVSPAGATMQVFGVGPAQTFVMNGDDSLVIGTPASFQGVIDAKAGDKVILGGVTANGAVNNGTSLVLEENGAPVYSLKLNAADATASFSTAAFGTGNTEITMTGGSAATTASTDPSTSSSAATLTGTLGATTVTDVTNGTTVSVPASTLGGSIGSVLSDFAQITPAALSVNPPSIFTSTGGIQSIDASGASGNAVVAVSGGSSFIDGGAGNDSFVFNAADPSSNSLSTILNFHSGDTLLLLGATPSNVSTADNVGAPGATGLDIAATTNGISTGAILAGHASSEFASGALSETYGSTNGTPYLKVSAT